MNKMKEMDDHNSYGIHEEDIDHHSNQDTEISRKGGAGPQQQSAAKFKGADFHDEEDFRFSSFNTTNLSESMHSRPREPFSDFLRLPEVPKKPVIMAFVLSILGIALFIIGMVLDY